MMIEDQVNDIIDIWRGTPAETLKPEDYQQFKHLGMACLAEGESEQLLKFTQDAKNQEVVKSMGCILLGPLVDKVVKKENCVDNCQATITHLTKICNPNELLHTMHELIEDTNPGAISETILTLIPHLETVLLRLDEDTATALGWTLLALQRQLSRLPVPYTPEQEDADEHGLCRCCTALIDFTKPFVEEVKRRDDQCGRISEKENLKIELRDFCMRSLREPLLEATLDGDKSSPLWLFAVSIMGTLHGISESIPALLLLDSERKHPQMDNSQSTKESRACLAYLLFVQLITIDRFPAVFSPMFVLQCNMEHVNQLLCSKKESHLLKGLALFTESLRNVQDQSLPLSLMTMKSFYSVSQNLRLVLTDCPLKHLRELGLQVYQLLINKLDAEAKHKFFRCILLTSNHAGLEGFIINNIRSQVQFSMKPGNSNDWFLGVEFLSLFRLMLSLPKGADTDLLENMDKIMESLNLVRFLQIRDKELRSRANVWEELCSIRDGYLKMLAVCISISKAHYLAQIKQLKENQKRKAKEVRDAERSNTIAQSVTFKQEDSNMSPEIQHQVFQSALVTFDLMDSLIARINEITEEKQTKQG